MDTKSSTLLVSNQEGVQQEDELQCEIAGRQNSDVTDTSNYNTPVSDFEAPLSPVLTNNKKSLRHIARTKSRIKLLNKFSQNSLASQESLTCSFTPLQLETQTPVKEKDQLSGIKSLELCPETSKINTQQETEKIESNNEDRDLEERMKRCIEMQRNRKFCYNIANNSTILLPASENKSVDIPVTNISKIINNESFVSNINIADCKNEPDFSFKIPESPVSQTKIKKCNKRASTEIVLTKIEPDFNLKVGFETGSGKKIKLSEKALKRAAKIFDDIEVQCESQNIPNNNENNFEEKAGIGLSKNINIGFKTASGNNLKLSESSLNKVQNLFDDILDLSNYNETHIQNINSTTSTSTEVELSNSFNQDVQTFFNDSFETQNTINSSNKTQFKIPTQVVEKHTNKVMEEISPDKKHLFSQITDTQMCFAAENAECLVEFMDSQWTPSPKNKSPLHKEPQSTEKNFDKSQEDFEELSPEAEELFGNLTMREDGTITKRNKEINANDIQETVDKNTDNCENLSMFEFSTASKKINMFQSCDVSVENLHENVETLDNISLAGFTSVSGENVATSEKSLEKAKQIVQDCEYIEKNLQENISSIGFATASGKQVTLSEESLMKAQLMFQDCDIIEDKNKICEESENISIGFSITSAKNMSVSEKSLKNAESNNRDQISENTVENVIVSKESQIKLQNISNDCNIEDNIKTINSGTITTSEKNVAISEEYLIKAKNMFSDCDVVKNIPEINIGEKENNISVELSSENTETETLSSDQEQVKYSGEQSTISEELFFTAENEDTESSNCCGFNWNETLKSLKICELYKRSFKYIEKDIKNNLFYPLNFIFNDIQLSKEYKNKNYKYFLRSKRRSNTIYSNKKSTRKSLRVSELLNTPTMMTRSKRNLVNDDSNNFTLINSLPKTRNKKRLSNTDNSKVTSEIEERQIEYNSPKFYTVENTDKVKSDIKRTITSLEDAFLSSVENFVTCKNISKEENFSSASLQNQSAEKRSNNTVGRSEENKDNMNIFNTPKIDIIYDLTISSDKITKAKDDQQKATKISDSDTRYSNIDLNIPQIEKILHKKIETSKNVSSMGFTTASGKKVAISEESLKKAKNIFEDCDVTEEILHQENLDTPETISSFDFATASGEKVAITKDIFEECVIIEENFDNHAESSKNVSSFGFATDSGEKVLISDEPMEKAKYMIEYYDVTDEIIRKHTPKNVSSFGFATTSGKKREIPEESLKKARNMFEDIDDTDEILHQKNLGTPKTISSSGLATTSGKKVAISEESLKKAKNIFEDCDFGEDILHKNVETPKNISSFGFATGSGKKVAISEESLTKAKNIFEDCDVGEDILHKNVETPKNISSFGFATASGKKVAISEKSLKKAKNIFEDCDVTEEILHNNVETPKNVSSCGFATASGKKVAISEESLKKARNIFEDCDVVEDVLHKNVETPKNVSSFGFATASGKKVAISEESLKKARNIFEDCDVGEDILHKYVETPKNVSSFGFATASGKKVAISEESLKKARNIFEDCDVGEDILHKNVETPKNVSSFGFATASGKKVAISEESLKKAKNIFEDCDVGEDILHKNVETPKNISSFGFSTASGKKVAISEESLKKAKNIFEDCDVTEEILHNNVETPKNVSSFGFATASGKKVAISEESLKKARNIFEDCDVVEDVLHKNVETPKNVSLFGFATASGKKVAISEESLKKARNIFEDCDVVEDVLHKNVETPKNVSSFGFATASGKKVAISEESLKKARIIFEDCDVADDVLHKNVETPKNVSSFGFATASGKKVAISEESLKKAKNIFDDCDISEEIKSSVSPKNASFEFATASGNKVAISEEALNTAKSVFNDDYLDNGQLSEDTLYTSDESHITVSTKTGFSTASGNKVSISEEVLNKVRNIFDDVENIEAEKSSKRQRNISESWENNANTLNTPINKFTKINSEQNVSVTEVVKKENVSSAVVPANKSRSSPNISSNNSTPVLRNRNMSARNSKKRSLGVSSCRQIDIAENSLKRAKLIFDDDTPKKKETIINNNNLVNYSPLANKTNIPVVNTPQTAVPKNNTPVSMQNKSLLNSTMSMKESNQLGCSPNLSTPKLSPLKTLYAGNDILQENLSFAFREKTIGDIKKWNADLQKEIEMLKLKMSVIETRMFMLNKQQEIIESGSSDHRRQRPGNLFSQKANSDTRLLLQTAVNRRPGRITHQICLNMGLESSILNITAENSLSLHFYVPWWPNDNRTYPAVIRTEDGAVIVPNQQNYIGITELEQAFLAMPGVDPSLVPKNWVSNHYRWIVWKLASLERNYPDIFKNYLSVENVMDQLKYRYDREIDRAQRPALRKIVECDDTAAKRMVLCVATIFRLENKYELELTDGWYSIKTTLDAPLSSLVERNVIKVGMKIITQGAELLNCEGCCPLELPSNVRLQIHYNSTRRAAWHAKLGYQPNPGPLRIALRMIAGNGGPVGGVRAYVARVYPISFMERSDAAIMWRNERAELRRANQWEAAYANTMENLQMKLQQELEKEWAEMAKKNKNRKLKIKDVRGLHCGKTLYQFMEESNDPDSVKEMLTPDQISALQYYQTELNTQRQVELAAKLREKLENEKLQPRSVSTVLKLLLVDVQSSCHHHMLSIWRPTESHTQLLKEGIVINIYNVTAKNNGTLSSIPRTQFDEDLDFDTTKFENLSRYVLPISQTSNSELKPFFGEYDTVGMVVHIDIQQTAQTMWVADENYRFLLIKIREGSGTCVLFDGVKPGKVVAVLNLIHQKPFKSYGEAVANHYTVLSSYPQQTYLQEFMKEFIDSLPEDVDGYLKECKNLAEEYSSQNLKHGYVLNPLVVNNSEEAIEAFRKQFCVVENTQQNKSESLTLSDEEMALIDTQVI